MILKSPDGHVAPSRASNEDQTTSISWHFFFMHDVEKSLRFIFDRMYTT